MYLIKEEKRTLFQFLWLYLGSSFLLFATIAYLFYQNESRFFYDNSKNQMQIEASRLASEITHTHMSGGAFSFKEAIKNNPYKIGFYDKNQKSIESSLSDKNSDSIIIVDKSAFGHLGVERIVIQKEGIHAFVEQLRYRVIGVLLLIYLIIGVIGYFLAKLFIKPIQMKRIQLDNFIKDSTHELNTPITALMLSIDSPMLQSPKNLERIRLSAKRIATIHQDLSYLMLDTQTLERQEAKKILLNDIIKEELTYLTLLAEKKKITFSVEYSNEIYFNIDQESFVRLIHNLITNAIKYNHIWGSIKVVVKDNTITIQDTGIGIPKEHQTEIYERFYRATNQVGGFGLGLNIVHKVCMAYGIGIEFESEVDKGTLFTLSF